MNRCVVMTGMLVSLMVGGPVPSAADDQDTGAEAMPLRKQVVVPAGKVINHDFSAFGETVEISGTVNGDVYAAGGQVLINGTVNGDLLVAGGTVTISGTVTQDARIAGGTVTNSGEIGRNMTIAGGHVEMNPAALIRGNLIVGGGHVELAAPIQHDVKIGAGTVFVSNRIDGNLTAAAGELRLTSTAAVAGNLVYWSHQAASIDDKATVSGKIIRRKIPADVLESAQNALAIFAGLKLIVTAASFVSTLILGLLFFRFYPVVTQLTMAHLNRRPLASFAVGLLMLILIPFVAAVCAVTVLGLPVAVILVAWALIVLYLSRIVAIAFAGRMIFKWLGVGDRWTFVFGLLLYSLLTLIPIFGGIVTMLTVLFGLGALLLTQKEVYREARVQGLI